jgi:hypothetical protein
VFVASQRTLKYTPQWAGVVVIGSARLGFLLHSDATPVALNGQGSPEGHVVRHIRSLLCAVQTVAPTLFSLDASAPSDGAPQVVAVFKNQTGGRVGY